MTPLTCVELCWAAIRHRFEDARLGELGCVWFTILSRYWFLNFINQLFWFLVVVWLGFVLKNLIYYNIFSWSWG